MNNSLGPYRSHHLAFVIPTKNRSRKLEKLLASLAGQSMRCGRVGVIDGGESVQALVMGFADRLPVEYHVCHPAGQIRQRNMGVALLDEQTPLVGLLDDDIVLEARALEAMIAFWGECGPETAGVSFNIVNATPERFVWLRHVFGLNAREPGRVHRSGMTTANYPVSANLRTQWLCGGATVWRRQVLQKTPHREIRSRWAIAEDLVFSYPVGKEYPLYVCADARARHEHEADYVSKMKHRYHGRTQTMWQFYFVESNADLSRLAFLWSLLVRITGKVLVGALTLRAGHIEFGIGQLEGAIKGLVALRRGQNIYTILSEDADDRNA